LENQTLPTGGVGRIGSGPWASGGEGWLQGLHNTKGLVELAVVSVVVASGSTQDERLLMAEAKIKIGTQELSEREAAIVRIAIDRWVQEEKVDVGSEDHRYVEQVKKLIEGARGSSDR
jgi:hypothetical protein